MENQPTKIAVITVITVANPDLEVFVYSTNGLIADVTSIGILTQPPLTDTSS